MMTKRDANKIAKAHMYSFFILGDGFYSDNSSPEDNQKITNEMIKICEKELKKLNIDSQGTSESCIKVILKKKYKR